MKIDLEYIARETPKRKKEFARLFQVQGKQIRRIDEEIHELHEQVFSETNCLDCGNCCRTLGPKVSRRDVQVLATFIRMKTVEVMDTYFKMDEDDDVVFQSMPCPFLLPDNYCSVYEARPKACREYPHTDRKRMIQLGPLSIANAAVCPAVFEILNRMKKPGVTRFER